MPKAPKTLPTEYRNRFVKMTPAVARDALPPPAGDYILRDDANRAVGLGLRIYSSGTKTWICQKKLGKNPCVVPLGHFPSLTLTAAIPLARNAASLIAKGVDPRLERKKQVAATEAEKARAKVTFGSLFDDYLESKKGKGKPRSQKDREAAKLRLREGPLWRMPANEVDEDALTQEYRRLVSMATKGTNGGRTQAGATIRWARAAYLDAPKHLGLNPAVFKDFGAKEPGWDKTNARKRIIAHTEEQLGKWWKAVDALRAKKDKRAADAPTIADFLQLSLLLGGRKTELLSLMWKDVYLDEGYILFLNTKNGTDHLVPFGTFAAKLLKRRFELHQTEERPSDYVFPASRKRRDGTYAHIQDPKKTLAAVAEAAKVPFSAYDLRRTFASLLNEIEHVSSITLQKMLNHTPDSVAGKHYIVTRIARLRPHYQRLEDAILAEAGVRKGRVATTTPDTTPRKNLIRIRKEGDRYIATAPTDDGVLEVEGMSAKEAMELLTELLP